ncbi:MAG TPA: hypothetical protein VFV01_47930 [Spirillospora sp.]|nr:hypothetical protein [Spirillospora sp.]
MSDTPFELDAPRLVAGCLVDHDNGFVVDAGQMLLVPGLGLLINHGDPTPADSHTTTYPAGQEFWLLTVPPFSPN